MPHNLVLAPNAQGYRLVLIDGLGLSTFLPLAKYSQYFAQRHIEKRYSGFIFVSNGRSATVRFHGAILRRPFGFRLCRQKLNPKR